MCARNWIAVGLFGELYSHLSIEPRLPFIFRLFSEEYIQEDFINRLFRICDSLSQLLVTLFCRIKVTFEYWSYSFKCFWWISEVLWPIEMEYYTVNLQRRKKANNSFALKFLKIQCYPVYLLFLVSYWNLKLHSQKKYKHINTWTI